MPMHVQTLYSACKEWCLFPPPDEGFLDVGETCSVLGRRVHLRVRRTSQAPWYICSQAVYITALLSLYTLSYLLLFTTPELG